VLQSWSDLTVSFGPGRTDLIGANGSGKSTLLRSAGITRWLRLDREAGLTAVEPP
jgi:ABC-type cobalamin/Fe3+-siderophores transport system ATPase subunit